MWDICHTYARTYGSGIYIENSSEWQEDCLIVWVDNQTALLALEFMETYSIMVEHCKEVLNKLRMAYEVKLI